MRLKYLLLTSYLAHIMLKDQQWRQVFKTCPTIYSHFHCETIQSGVNRSQPQSKLLQQNWTNLLLFVPFLLHLLHRKKVCEKDFTILNFNHDASHFFTSTPRRLQITCEQCKQECAANHHLEISKNLGYALLDHHLWPPDRLHQCLLARVIFIPSV